MDENDKDTALQLVPAELCRVCVDLCRLGSSSQVCVVLRPRVSFCSEVQFPPPRCSTALRPWPRPKCTEVQPESPSSLMAAAAPPPLPGLSDGVEFSCAHLASVGTSRCLPLHPCVETLWVDSGSLRAGGVTWLLQVTEDATLVQRRGRWISAKVMEIYPGGRRESFIHKLDPSFRDRILRLAGAFDRALCSAEFWSKHCIPPASWYFFTYTAALGSLSGSSGRWVRKVWVVQCVAGAVASMCCCFSC